MKERDREREGKIERERVNPNPNPNPYLFLNQNKEGKTGQAIHIENTTDCDREIASHYPGECHCQIERKTDIVRERCRARVRECSSTFASETYLCSTCPSLNYLT